MNKSSLLNQNSVNPSCLISRPISSEFGPQTYPSHDRLLQVILTFSLGRQIKHLSGQYEALPIP